MKDVIRWCGIIISITLTGLILWKIDIKKFVEILNNINYILLLPGILLYLFGYILRAIRWQYLLAHTKKINLYTLFTILIIGFMANNILPARAGEFIRAYMLGVKEQQSKSLTLATVILERIFDGLTFVFLFTIVWIFLPLPDWIKNIGIFSTFIFVTALLLMIILRYYNVYFFHLLQYILFWLSENILYKIFSLFHHFIKGLEILHNIQEFLKVGLLSILIWIIEAGMYYFTIISFDIKLPLLGVILLMVIANLGIMLPSAPGYIGVFQVAVLGVLWRCFNLEYNLSLAIAVILHGIIVIPVTILGFIFLTKENFSWQMIKSEVNKFTQNKK
jgi:hypothetical protein